MVRQAPQFFAGSILTSARSASLPFYRVHRLIELHFTRDHGPERAFVLRGSDDVRWLNGSSEPLHDTNESESLALVDENVQDYLRFFLYFLRGDEGAFDLVESTSDLTVFEDNDKPDRGVDSAEDDRAELAARYATIRDRIAPLRTLAIDATDRWEVEAALRYGGYFFVSTFTIASQGFVEMLADEPIETLDDLAVPECPSLELRTNPIPASWFHSDDDRGTATGGGSHDPAPLPRDRDVTEAIVAVLLEDAIRERDSTATDSNMLLQHFNSETGADRPIDRLARLMLDSMPVIVIESDVPFVEDFVAGVINRSGGFLSDGGIERAVGQVGGDLGRVVNYKNMSTELHLLSFHVSRSDIDAERSAHELALRDVSVLIGCNRAADVPEPLRRIADLVLTFPRIDRRRFGRIFERVFDARPTPGWDGPGADWTRYLVPADFHMPRRLGLDPDQALLFLRERVQARLRQVTPDRGPALSELHGLGEARQICEDLVADIRAAQAGQIPWTDVDKGLLLTGAPGTGKTTLARALAKECGIKFLAASAAAWQSAGALDVHIRAIVADFNEARRYAPAILFLDEIDSIGSRENAVGQNAQYQTDVIDALLEQIQGINSIDPVIVIGATNYLEKVDPALRRAGRLDQVVHVPLPNIASLEQILSYYLAPHRAAKQVARGINMRTLAELSWGLTGADVEFFVRGAARRARRAKRKINQSDLLAEITRRPRRPDSAPRLNKVAMRRVAVHEAGHTVARLISSSRGETISFITIIPRMDGTHGFVASVPPEGQIMTRRAILEELEATLAGRAAEEVVFGADDISTGAGGPDRSSDLAVATRLATMVACQTGLGGDGALYWTEEPTATQEVQIVALLANAYSSIVARLEANRALLDGIVSILEDKQELSGVELRQMLAKTDGMREGGEPG